MCDALTKGKVTHLSRMVAANAATLHTWTHPGCVAIEPYPCGDHWHIGHRSRQARAACPPSDRSGGLGEVGTSDTV